MHRYLPALGLLLLAGPAVAQADFGDLYKKAMGLYGSGKYAAALPVFQQVLGLAQQAYGPDSPLLSVDYNNLGQVNRRLGRFDAAEGYYKRAIELDERGSDNAEGLATSLNNLGQLYSDQKRLSEAEPLYKRSLGLLQDTLGPDDGKVAASLNNLAVLYRMQGEVEKARPLQERAVALADKALGPDHPNTKTFRHNLELITALPKPVAGVPPARAPKPGQLKPGQAQLGQPQPGQSKPGQAQPGPAQARVQPPGQPASQGRPVVIPRSGLAAEPGSYAVHVASVRNPADAAGEWQRFAARLPMLAGLRLRSPQAVDVAGKGLFYRVAGGSFPSRAEAEALCAQVRARGVYCAVINP